MKYSIQIFMVVLLFTSNSFGQTMENVIFYGTCRNENVGKVETFELDEELPTSPFFILEKESLVSVQGILPNCFQMPNACDIYLPHLDCPMFDYRDGRRYLVVFGKKKVQKSLDFHYDWQFMDYEVHIYDLDETSTERNYRQKMTATNKEHVKISSLKKIQEKVDFWQNVTKKEPVSLAKFISDMGKPFHITFDEKERTAILTFDYYVDIENREEALTQRPKDSYPEIVRPRIVAIEKNGNIIEIKYVFDTITRIPDSIEYRDTDCVDISPKIEGSRPNSSFIPQSLGRTLREE